MSLRSIVLASCAVLALSVSAAYAAYSTDGTAVRHVAHKHHVARHRPANAPVSDVPQESAAPATSSETTAQPDKYNPALDRAGSGTSY